MNCCNNDCNQGRNCSNKIHKNWADKVVITIIVIASVILICVIRLAIRLGGV